MIASLEALARAAWPAHEEQALDGWLLCLSGGRTRRTNSAQPLAAGELPLDEKIARCEAFYRSAGQPAVFKLTPASEPQTLDRRLAELGYALADPTCVSCADLEPLLRRSAHEAQDSAIALDRVSPAAWLEACEELTGIDAEQKASLGETLARSAAANRAHAFVTLTRGATPVAQGFGVVCDDALYLAQLVTAPSERRHGLGRRTVLALCGWGAQHGAKRALLQVVASNAPAVALYADLGFEEAYRYWYRMHPDCG